MRKWIRSHLTYANVMATIAVFGVIAGGSAWAASKIGTSDIKNGAVTAKKLHNKAATAKKIKNDAVGADKLGNVVMRTHSIPVPAGSARIVSKNCDPGELALSVGANWNGATTVGPVLQAATFLNGQNEPTGGSATGRNEGAGARMLSVSVACLTP